MQPSAEELTQYARYLGIDPIFNADLLWIAEQVGLVLLYSKEHHIEDALWILATASNCCPNL